MNIGILGAPVDLGADRRGVDMGPSAIRYAGLEDALTSCGHNVRDYGNVTVPIPERAAEGPHDLKYLAPISTMAEELATRVRKVREDERFPLVLGGDHSLSLGSVAGSATDRTIGAIWVDAHGDFNTTETSPSGNIHGMVLAALCGYGDPRLTELAGPAPKLRPANTVLVAVRELDPGERRLMKASGVHVFTMHDIDRLGLAAVIGMAAERATADTGGFHLSLDLDVVDPMQAPGVGTPVLGGLSYRETHLAMELLSTTGALVSMDVVEVNPIFDNHNETARLAMEFTLSACGKRIF